MDKLRDTQEKFEKLLNEKSANPAAFNHGSALPGGGGVGSIGGGRTSWDAPEGPRKRLSTAMSTAWDIEEELEPEPDEISVDFTDESTLVIEQSAKEILVDSLQQSSQLLDDIFGLSKEIIGRREAIKKVRSEQVSEQGVGCEG